MLITFEGIDGAGKSSQMAMLSRLIPGCVMTSEPDGTALGRALRHDINLHRPSNAACYYLFLAAREEHCHTVIRPALAEGLTVLCDRYIHSTAAYQQEYYDIGSMDLFPKPDYVIYIDIPSSVAAQRLPKSNEYFEQDIKYLERVRETYHHILNGSDSVIWVKGTYPPSVVHQNIVQELTNRGVLCTS